MTAEPNKLKAGWPGAERRKTTWNGVERRKCPALLVDDQQIEEIAEKAAEKAVELMQRRTYEAIGKNILSRAAWLAGALAVGLYLWMKQKGLVD